MTDCSYFRAWVQMCKGNHGHPEEGCPPLFGGGDLGAGNPRCADHSEHCRGAGGAQAAWGGEGPMLERWLFAEDGEGTAYTVEPKLRRGCHGMVQGFGLLSLFKDTGDLWLSTHEP